MAHVCIHLISHRLLLHSLSQQNLMKTRCPCPRRGLNRSIQKITIINSSNITFNTHAEPRKKNKSVELTKKRQRSPAKQAKESIVAKPQVFDINEEMRKCRDREMAVIRKNVALLKYYNCMITLFMITYTSCQVMATNFFQVKRKSYCFPEVPNQFGINFVGLLLKLYQTVKHFQYEARLRRLAINLLKISPTASDFQRKAEFISRKVVLNNEKSKDIEMSFMSLQLENFWDRLTAKVFISSQVEFMEDMFELEPERLCVKNFQTLIEKYLSTEQFESDLREQNLFREGDSNNHSFSIEFLLIEKLCTQDYQEERQDLKEEKKKRSCEIY